MPEKGNTASTRHVVTGSWQKVRNLTLLTIGDAAMQRKRSIAGTKEDHNWKGLHFEPHHTWAILHCSSEEHHRENAAAFDTPA
jgi:hypothetical protein